MKFLAVLLCMSGLAAVCLGQTNTTDATTAESTTSGLMVPTSPAGSLGTDGATTASASSGGGGATGTASAGGTTPATYTCMNCTGDETSACGRGDGTTVTATVTCDACWAYRDENTTSGEVTYIRGCALDSDTCTTAAESELCKDISDISRCSRCCKTNECNDDNLELDGVPGSGAADVHVSVVVTMASALFAILALW